MDRRQIGIGAMLLFLSSVVSLQTGLIGSRVPVAIAGMTALGVAAGAVVLSATAKPERA